MSILKTSAGNWRRVSDRLTSRIYKNAEAFLSLWVAKRVRKPLGKRKVDQKLKDKTKDGLAFTNDDATV